MTVRLDYETYSEADLPSVGLWRYAEDPSTEVLCFAWKVDNEPVKWWAPGEDFPWFLAHAIKRGDRIKAWNAEFECAITEKVAHKFGFPVPRRDQWECTMAKAAMCAMPRKLGVCARVMKLGEQKDKEGQRLLKLFSMPRKPTKGDPRTRIYPQDEPDDFSKLIDYCIQDVNTEEAVDLALPVPALPPQEQRLWTTHLNINARGILLDRGLAAGAARLKAAAMAEAAAELSKLTRTAEKPKGYVTAATQTQKLKEWCALRGVTVESTDKEHMPLLLAQDLPADVRAALEIRAEAGQSSTSKYDTMSRVMCADDRARGSHAFDEADTGRWSNKQIQFQNLPRPAIDLSCYRGAIRAGDPVPMEMVGDRLMTVLRDSIRHAVIAPPGKVLSVCDFASIEARVLGWLADEPFYLDAYRQGKDLYCEMATKIYGRTITKKDKDERFIGKESVLGLGYSMWKDTFAANVAKKAKSKIKREITDRAAEVYRKVCPHVVQFWKDIERVSHACVASKRKLQYKMLGFEMVGTYFTIILPSGRRLWYPEARLAVKQTKWGPKSELRFRTNLADGEKWEWFESYTYGGRLTENVDQAIARDLLAEALVKCENEGIDVVMHIHDEINAETEPGKSARLREIMIENPAWAKGLPLDAEAFETPFYRK